MRHTHTLIEMSAMDIVQRLRMETTLLKYLWGNFDSTAEHSRLIIDLVAAFDYAFHWNWPCFAR